MFVEYPFSCFTFNYKLLILYFKLLKSNFYLLFCSLSFYELFIIYTAYLLKYQQDAWTLTSSKDEQARSPKMLQDAATSILPAPQRNSPEVSCLPLSHLPGQTRRSKLPPAQQWVERDGHVPCCNGKSYFKTTQPFVGAAVARTGAPPAQLRAPVSSWPAWGSSRSTERLLCGIPQAQLQ